MLPTANRRFWISAGIVSAVLLLAGFLAFVFSGRLILPQYFRIGPLPIHYYGIIMALAVTSAFYVALKRAPLYGINLHSAEDILFWIIIGGFIGARLYHVLSSISYYQKYPIDIIKVWNGGLSIYGAVLGGIFTLWAAAKIAHLKFNILNLLDWLAPSVVLGQIIGRFGNLLNYEAYGYPTHLPWKMFVPSQFRPQAYQAFIFFHPWFLYEALGNTVILFLLLKFIKPKVPGALVFWYLLLYNALRFCLEFLRIDSTFIHGLRLNAMTSLALVVISAVCLMLVKKDVQTP